MGEFADMALSDVMDEEDMSLDYRLGFIGREEAYDRGIIDERGYEHHAGRRGSTKTCSFCKAAGLHWQATAHGWRLFEPTNKIHNCGHLPKDETGIL